MNEMNWVRKWRDLVCAFVVSRVDGGKGLKLKKVHAMGWKIALLVW